MNHFTDIQSQLVSIIIPVYNRSRELERAILSVLAQTHQHVEILVVDDGSTEDIKGLCQSFDDKRILYYRSEPHKNANVARNMGIQKAKGEFIAMLDSDDEYLPFHLQARLERIYRWQCDGIHGSAYIQSGGRKKIKISRPRYQHESMCNYLMTDGFAPTPSHFYKTEAARQILWDEDFERHQDYDFSIRFAEKYDFLSDYRPSILVHWPTSPGTKDFFAAQKKFLQKHGNNMSLAAKINYLHLMLKKARQRNDEPQIDFYRTELSFCSYKTSRFFMLVYVKTRAKIRKLFYLSRIRFGDKQDQETD